MSIMLMNMFFGCVWSYVSMFLVVFRCFECANRLRWLEFLEVSPSSTNLTSTVTTCQELLRFQEERRIAAMVKLAERDRQDRQARCSMFIMMCHLYCWDEQKGTVPIVRFIPRWFQMRLIFFGCVSQQNERQSKQNLRQNHRVWVPFDEGTFGIFRACLHGIDWNQGLLYEDYEVFRISL
jgi:hypothetical protein